MEMLERMFIEPLQRTLERLQAFLPQLFAALLILACGLLAGWLVKVVVRRVLQWFKFDEGCQRIGLGGLLGRGGVSEAPSLVLARLSGGLVVLVFLLLAVSSFDVVVLQNLTERFLVYLPNIIVAGLLLIVAWLLGNFCGRAVLIACVNSGLGMARFCARLVQTLVVSIGVVMALEQLGIGKETVLLAFGIAFGGAVLALAIAFGLGGRKIAREYLEKRLRNTDGEDDIKHL